MRRARDMAEMTFGLAALTYGFCGGWVVGFVLFRWLVP